MKTIVALLAVSLPLANAAAADPEELAKSSGCFA